MNKAMIIGNLTRDPDLRTTSNTGTSVCSFTVAVSRKFNKEESDFIPVVVWNSGKYKLADYCAERLQKGSQVAVSGAIQTRHYENQDGKRVYITEIIADEVKFLSRTKEVSDTNIGKPSTFQKPVSNAPQQVDISDDLPF